MPSDIYIFISYSQHDKAFVERLSSDLQRGGFRVWRDLEQILPGTDWQHEIVRGLKEASALLFVSSRHSAKSGWMQNELGYFVGRAGTRIIPIVIDDTGADEMPDVLRKIQWVDFRTEYDLALATLLKACKALLPQGAPAEAAPMRSKGYVFISYADEDSDFVGNLKQFLKRHGYAFWEYEDSDRDYHTQLFRELESVISDAAATLSVLSEAWKASVWTPREYFFSQEVGTPVFLLRARPIGPTLAIAGFPYIDFIADPARGYEKLEKELKRKKL